MIDDCIDQAAAMPTLKANTTLSTHDFFSREMYMALEAADIRWVLDSHRPTLARYGYDLLYEAWLEAIEGRETSETATAENIRLAMLVTRGIGNWGENWASV